MPGEHDEVVLRQLVTSVEFGFEKASSYQKSMVKQIETPVAPLTDTEKNEDNYLPVFNVNNTVCHPIIKIRCVENNRIITNTDNGIFNYAEIQNGLI